MLSRYDVRVDPRAPNNAHAYALELVGWNRRVLELGAASGHVTRALAEQRCRVTAVEFDAAAAQELVGVAEEIVVGDLNDPLIFEGLAPEFDVVLAGDVLEHLLRPQDVLSRAAALVKPGGRLVISLPHVGHVDVRLSLMKGSWDYRAWGLMDETHTRFFTLKTIEAMVKEAGLVITELRRVRIPAFETELNIDRATVPTQALELALADPEAETYQFVFSAVPDRFDPGVERLIERNLALEQELVRARVARGALEAACREQLAAQAEDHEQAVGALQVQLHSAHRSLQRVEDSVCWRSFQRVRARLFAILGGERSPGVRVLQGLLRRAGGRR